MPMTVVGVRPGRAGFDWLRQRVIAAQRGDPLAPVTVVVPNHYVGLWLRRELAQSGYANVRFEVLERLAERLGAGALAMQGWTPMRAVIEEAAIRESISASKANLGEVAGHPALIQALRDLFHRLRERETSPAEVTAWRGMGNTANAALHVFQAFEDLIERHRLYDDRLVLDAATATIGTASLRELGTVVIYLPTRLPPASVRFIQALSSRADVVTGLAVVSDPAADNAAHADAAALGANLDLAAIPGRADHRVLIAPDASEEIRAVCRDVLTDLSAGIPLHRVAILYRAREPYANLVPEILSAAGLPWAALEGRPLARSFVAYGLLRLLALAERGLRRVDVLEWRSSLPDAGQGDVSFADWNRLTREAGVIRGADQWRERLARLAAELRQAAEDPDLSDASRDSLIRRAERSEVVAARVAGLALALVPPTDRTWSAYVKWAVALRREFVHPHNDTHEQDAAQLVDEVVQGLAKATPLSSEVTPEVFGHTLESALEGQRRPQGKVGVGVVVGPLASARGFAFDRVYLVGMTDGLFPPRPAPDPIFLDADPLGDRDRQASEERAHFRAAIAAADGGAVQCSAPAWDSEMRPSFGAPWLVEVAEEISGSGVTAAQLRTTQPRGWRRVPSPDAGLAGSMELNLAERRTSEARAWRAKGSLYQSALAQRPDLPLARALELGRSRRSAELSEFDGNLLNVAAESSRLRQGIAARSTSASAIERWCTCPFHYFLERVLFIKPTEQPEDEEGWTILPAVRGSLMHKVLERFVRELILAGRLGIGDVYTRDDHARLDEIAAELFGELEVTGRTGYALAWENERAAILRDLHTFLLRDERYRDEWSLIPASVEQGFGMQDEGSWPALVVAIGDGTELRMRGKIDRVDVAPTLDAPTRAVLTDYKTGHVDAATLSKDALAAGRSVQLAAYSIAVREYLRSRGTEDPTITAGYWQITARHRFRRTDLDTGPDLDERLRVVLTTVNAGVARGAFPQSPGDEQIRPERLTWENCSYCEYDRICPAGRGQLADRKADDPAVVLHRSLAQNQQ